VLKEGTVAERGTHAELLARQGLYATMWQQQLVDEQKRLEGGAAAADDKKTKTE
jgi:hypothetical protein